MITKTADSKGRVSLGENFAGKTVILDQIDETEIRVTLARIIPEREAWLYENPARMAHVREGLAEAAKGDFVDGPDLAGDAKLADQMGE